MPLQDWLGMGILSVFFELYSIVITSIIVILLIFLIIRSKIKMNTIMKELERISHKFG